MANNYLALLHSGDHMADPRQYQLVLRKKDFKIFCKLLQKGLSTAISSQNIQYAQHENC